MFACGINKFFSTVQTSKTQGVTWITQGHLASGWPATRRKANLKIMHCCKPTIFIAATLEQTPKQQG